MKEQILKLKSKGLNQTQISEKLGCSKSTVSYHLNDKTKLLNKQKLRRRLKKLSLIDYKGGSCERCGYNKCKDALEFHHVDPLQKSFTIGNYNSYSINKLKKEVDKCELLCANCHREEHSNL